MNPEIFRQYDIRGIVDQDFNEIFAFALGYHFAMMVKEKFPLDAAAKGLTISCGRDARESGEKLQSHLIQGLRRGGLHVLQLGIVPTPLTYFSLYECKPFSSIESNHLHGSIAVTGSHNPPEFNGFKISLGTDSFHSEDLLTLRERILQGPSLEALMSSFQNPSEEIGTLTQIDIIKPYITYLQKDIRIQKPLKVVVDAGNAVGGLVAPELLKALGCEVIPLYCELDGRFPNHHPDPTVEENLTDLKAKVLESGADVGIGYDGDADRIGVVDEQGKTIYGDELMVLFSREILSRKPGAKIIGEVKCSHRLYNDIQSHGGVPIMWKTGHSLIKSKLKSEKAELAGEMSGHIFFSDRYLGYDDAFYATARLLEIMSRTDLPLSALLADLPTSVNTPEIRVECEDRFKFDVVNTVKNSLSNLYKIVDTDGVRIEDSRGWGLLRASNTQPVVVMRFEAESLSDLSRIRGLIEGEFQNAYERARKI